MSVIEKVTSSKNNADQGAVEDGDSLEVKSDFHLADVTTRYLIAFRLIWHNKHLNLFVPLNHAARQLHNSVTPFLQKNESHLCGDSSLMLKDLVELQEVLYKIHKTRERLIVDYHAVVEESDIDVLRRYLELAPNVIRQIKTSGLDHDDRFLDSSLNPSIQQVLQSGKSMAFVRSRLAIFGLHDKNSLDALATALEKTLPYITVCYSFAKSERSFEVKSLPTILSDAINSVDLQNHPLFNKGNSFDLSELSQSTQIRVDDDIFSFAVQRIISNAMHHLNGDEQHRLAFVWEEGSDTLVYADDGVGFDSYSLQRIGELRRAIGGNLSGGVGLSFFVQVCLVHGIKVEFGNGYSSPKGTNYPGAYVKMKFPSDKVIKEVPTLPSS